MDNEEVLTATLNTVIERHAKTVQAYETQIARMTAELIRLKSMVDALAPNQEKSEEE